MIYTIIIFAILAFIPWLGFKIMGVLLEALIWLFIRLPLALLAWMIGMICCCTIILIPVGIWFVKAGGRLFVPV